MYAFLNHFSSIALIACSNDLISFSFPPRFLLKLLQQPMPYCFVSLLFLLSFRSPLVSYHTFLQVLSFPFAPPAVYFQHLCHSFFVWFFFSLDTASRCDKYQNHHSDDITQVCLTFHTNCHKKSFPLYKCLQKKFHINPCCFAFLAKGLSLLLTDTLFNEISCEIKILKFSLPILGLQSKDNWIQALVCTSKSAPQGTLFNNFMIKFVYAAFINP